jgi:hypothetical protein
MSEIMRTVAWLLLAVATMQVFFPEAAQNSYDRYLRKHYEQWQHTNPPASPIPSPSPTPSDRFKTSTSS